MIKSENYGKITEIYREIPLKTLKKFGRASLGDWAGGGGDFSNFLMTGGF